MSGYSRGRGRAYGRPLDREHPPPRRPYDRPTEAPGPSRQPVNSKFLSLASQLNHNVSRFFSPEDTYRGGILFDDTSGLHLHRHLQDATKSFPEVNDPSFITADTWSFLEAPEWKWICKDQEDAELSPGQVEIHFTSFRRSSDLILAAFVFVVFQNSWRLDAFLGDRQASLNLLWNFSGLQ